MFPGDTFSLHLSTHHVLKGMISTWKRAPRTPEYICGKFTLVASIAMDAFMYVILQFINLSILLGNTKTVN